MGVHGLWQLLQPTGRPVTLESLEGKVLAIDVSVWLHQALKGSRDAHGGLVPHAHLAVLLQRTCKLLYYRIKPVFVFDGGVPALKKETLARRRQKRLEAAVESDQTSQKLVNNLLKQHAIQAVLGPDAAASTAPVRTSRPRSTQPDMFALNPLPETDRPEENEDTDGWEERMANRQAIYEQYADLSSVDVESAEFCALPHEMQHEILTELRERSKTTGWANIDTLPQESHEFSSYQMDKLMRASKLTLKLDEVRRQLNQRAAGIHPGQAQDDIGDVEARRIVSDDSTHYILIRGLRERRQRHLEVKDTEPTNKKKPLVNTDKKIKEQKEAIGSSNLTPGLPKDPSNESNSCETDINKSTGAFKMAENEFQDGRPGEAYDTALSASLGLSDIIARCKQIVKNKRKATDATGLKETTTMLPEVPNKSGENHQDSKFTMEPNTSQTEVATVKVAVDYNCESEVALNVLPSVNDEHENMIKKRVLDSHYKTEDCINNEEDTSTNSIHVVLDDTSNQVAYTDNVSSQSNVVTEDKDISCEIHNMDQSNIKYTSKVSDQNVDSSDQSADLCDQNKDPVEPAASDKFDTEGGLFMDESSVDEMPLKSASSNQTQQRFIGSNPSDVNDVTGINDVSDVNDVTDVSDVKKSTNEISDSELAKQITVQQPMENNSSVRNSSISVNEENRDRSATLLQTRSNAVPSSPHVEISSDSDESDDDLIEVTINPQAPLVEDELFPPSLFQTSQSDSSTPREQQSVSNEDQSDKRVMLAVNNEVSTISGSDNIHSEVKEHIDQPSADSREREEISRDTAETSRDCVRQLLSQGDLADVQGALNIESQALAEERGKQQRLATGLSDHVHAEAQLAYERGKQQRLATGLSDHIHAEAQELLRLLGVPWIVAPGEAEAQCAHLDVTSQTAGSITEDSDIWLFGGKTVYKNFFQQSRVVECYSVADIEAQLVLDRDLLIGLAYLCGSDYTEGVVGVGPVTALELLAEFPGPALQALEQLRARWEERRADKHKPAGESKILTKLRAYQLAADFPRAEVYEAYMKPEVDESRERFSWGTPDLDLLREFAAEKLAWSRAKLDDMLMPVLQRLNQSQAQSKLTNYFTLSHPEPAKAVKSSRMQNTIARMRGNKGKVTTGQPIKSTKTGNQSRRLKQGKGGQQNRKKGSKGGGGYMQSYTEQADVVLSEGSSSSSDSESETGKIQCKLETGKFHSQPAQSQNVNTSDQLDDNLDTSVLTKVNENSSVSKASNTQPKKGKGKRKQTLNFNTKQLEEIEKRTRKR